MEASTEKTRIFSDFMKEANAGNISEMKELLFDESLGLMTNKLPGILLKLNIHFSFFSPTLDMFMPIVDDYDFKKSKHFITQASELENKLDISISRLSLLLSPYKNKYFWYKRKYSTSVYDAIKKMSEELDAYLEKINVHISNKTIKTKEVQKDLKEGASCPKFLSKETAKILINSDCLRNKLLRGEIILPNEYAEISLSLTQPDAPHTSILKHTRDYLPSNTEQRVSKKMVVVDDWPRIHQVTPPSGNDPYWEKALISTSEAAEQVRARRLLLRRTRRLRLRLPE